MKNKFYSVFALTLAMLAFSANSYGRVASALTVTISSTNLSCNGGNNGVAISNVSGGTPVYTYLWLPGGETTATATGLSASTYTVIVTDALSATASATITITQPAPFSASSYVYSNVLCNGDNNGCAGVNVTGGTPPYTYLWTPNGSTSDSTCGLTSAVYTITVVDDNGYTATTTVTITQPSVLTAVYMGSTNNISCLNPNGSATYNVAGGTPPYTYLWSPSGETNAAATGLGAGTYTLTVTDNSGCIPIGGPLTATVSGLPGMTLTATATPDTIYPASLSILVANCNMTATYLWSTGATTSTIIVNPSVTTTYTLIATSTCGNDTATVTVVVVPFPCSSNTFTEPICIVTLDTATNKCEVIWGVNNSPPDTATSSYNIYRDSSSTWVLIHNQSASLFSDYVDAGSNPSAGPVSYEISTVDSCGESALSPMHTSIFLTTTSGFNVYILNWTSYVGFSPSKYRIYRGPTLSTLTLLDSVSNTVFTYHDTLPPLGSYYLLEAVNPSSPCVPVRKSKLGSSSPLSGALSNGFNTGTLTGIQNKNNFPGTVNIYPNPANNVLNVLVNGVVGNANIYITDVLGRRVVSNSYKLSGNGSKISMNIESLQPGVYFLTIETNGQKIVKKVTKL